MKYKEIQFNIKPYSEDVADALMAALGEIGYDSFENIEDGFQTWIKKDQFDPTAIDQLEILKFFADNFAIKYTVSEIEDRDWNAEWEKNFTPILIDNKILVRAEFHPSVPSIEYEILIEPKMSFGTGHHATTVLMLESIYEIADKIKGKQVLDMGCGTGILGIMARKVGAADVLGIDIDEWAYSNAMENIMRNSLNHIEIRIGDVLLLKTAGMFDVIFANINRNILLRDMSHYIEHLNDGGYLIISGFYTQDLPYLHEKAESLGVSYLHFKTKDNWVAATFYKK